MPYRAVISFLLNRMINIIALHKCFNALSGGHIFSTKEANVAIVSDV